MRKLLFLIVVLVVIVAGLGAASGLVNVPVLSSALGTDKARDLGEAAPDAAAYQAWAKKLGLSFPSPAANYTWASRHGFAGSVAIDETVPEAVLMAIREFSTAAPGISGASVRFHAGYMETSAIMDLAPYGYPISGPVYAKVELVVNGPRSVTVAVKDVTVGLLPIPGPAGQAATDALNDYLATRLASIDGLDIQQLAFVEGGVQFKGSVPTTYTAQPPKAGDLP